jgi:hypothetical protein
MISPLRLVVSRVKKNAAGSPQRVPSGAHQQVQAGCWGLGFILLFLLALPTGHSAAGRVVVEPAPLGLEQLSARLVGADTLLDPALGLRPLAPGRGYGLSIEFQSPVHQSKNTVSNRYSQHQSGQRLKNTRLALTGLRL